MLVSGSVLLTPPVWFPSVRRQNMKVRINATGDTIVMKFVRPGPDVKLEGYILGYGRSVFSKQFIQLPENGQLYETELGKNRVGSGSGSGLVQRINLGCSASYSQPKACIYIQSVWKTSLFSAADGTQLNVGL